MLRLQTINIIAVVSSSFFITGCTDLKAVNSFAIVSRQIVENNKYINYGYYEYSLDSTAIYTPIPNHLRDVDCNCSYIKQADTILSKECNILSSYYTTLALFTDPKSAISLNQIGKTVQAGTYGQLEVTTREAGIASGLASGLADILNTSYKSKELQRFLNIYQDSVAPLIHFLRLHADNLAGKVQNLQMDLSRIADSLMDKTSNKESKWSILFVYRQKMTALDEILNRYTCREADFKAILNAGQFVYDNRSNLQSSSFKKKLKILMSNLSLNANF